MAIRGLLRWFCLMLAVFLVTGIACADEQPSSIERALYRAAENPLVGVDPFLQDRFAAVYERDGLRYGVLDFTVPGAPSASPIIDGALLDQLGLDHLELTIKKYHPPLVTTPKAQGGTQATKEYRFYKNWLKTWHHDGWHGPTLEERRTIRPGIGGDNTTDSTITFATRLQISGTLTVNSKLPKATLARLGLQAGLTVADEVALEVIVPRGQFLEAVPMITWSVQTWSETRARMRCGKRFFWQTWCSGPAEWVWGETATGRARIPQRLYAAIRRV